MNNKAAKKAASRKKYECVFHSFFPRALNLLVGKGLSVVVKFDLFHSLYLAKFATKLSISKHISIYKQKNANRLL